jgi:hypothetical protein
MPAISPPRSRIATTSSAAFDRRVAARMVCHAPPLIDKSPYRTIVSARVERSPGTAWSMELPILRGSRMRRCAR